MIADLFELGRAQAAELDASGPACDAESGPLAGVPFLLKDLGAHSGHTRGDGLPRAAHPRRDGNGVDRRGYLSAGLMIFGKTNTPEWGNHCTTEPSLFGPTVNPWSPSITPGGSSGGSAAAVAAGVLPAASGGDGTGSTAYPRHAADSSASNRAAAEARSRQGLGTRLEGLVNGHALTRTVRDSAALLDVIAGAAPGDPDPHRHRRSAIWM